jgi:hypothetical protein
MTEWLALLLHILDVWIQPSAWMLAILTEIFHGFPKSHKQNMPQPFTHSFQVMIHKSFYHPLAVKKCH